MKAIFSVYGSLVISILMGGLIALGYEMATEMDVVVLFAPAFVFGKLFLAYHLARGSGYAGLTNLRSGVFTLECIKIFKMKPAMLFLICVILVLVLIILWLSFSPYPSSLLEQTVRNLRALSLSLFSGVALALIHWSLRWEDYFYLSESRVRAELKAKGYEEDLESAVARFRKNGAFGDRQQKK